MGRHLTLRGGVIWTRYSKGEDFFGFLLEGDRFFDLEGGISFRLLYKNFKNFPKFSGQGGGLFGFLAQIFLKGGGNILPKSPLPEGEEPPSKIFLGGGIFSSLL